MLERFPIEVITRTHCCCFHQHCNHFITFSFIGICYYYYWCTYNWYHYPDVKSKPLYVDFDSNVSIQSSSGQPYIACTCCPALTFAHDCKAAIMTAEQASLGSYASTRVVEVTHERDMVAPFNADVYSCTHSQNRLPGSKALLQRT